MYTSTIPFAPRYSVAPQAPVLQIAPAFQQFIPRIISYPSLSWRIEENTEKEVLVVVVDMPGIKESDKPNINLKANWIPYLNGSHVFEFGVSFTEPKVYSNLLSHSDYGFLDLKGEYSFRSTAIATNGVYNLNKPQTFFIANGQLRIVFEKNKTNILG